MQFGIGHPPPTHQLQSTCVGEGSRVPNLQTEFKSYGIFSDFVVPVVPTLFPWSPRRPRCPPRHPCVILIIPIAPRRSPCGPRCPHIIPVSSLSSPHHPHSPQKVPMWSPLSPHHPCVILVIPTSSP